VRCEREGDLRIMDYSLICTIGYPYAPLWELLEIENSLPIFKKKQGGDKTKTRKVSSMFLAAAMIVVVFTAVPTNVSASATEEYYPEYNTLITEHQGEKVTEVDGSGTIVWQKPIPGRINDAERMPSGNTLIIYGTPGQLNTIAEMDTGGSLLWSLSGYNAATDIEYLNGGTMIVSEFNADIVMEIDMMGTVVWSKGGLNQPADAERLANGNTLISEFGGNRVTEVDPSGTVVWQKTGLYWPHDAERLANGNTLITVQGEGRVIEVNPSGTVVWQKTGFNRPVDAERLKNGNTLVADFYAGKVIEFDSNGNVVWEKTGLNTPHTCERLEPAGPSSPKANLDKMLDDLEDTKLGDDGKIDNKLDKAIEHLQKSLNIDPENPGEAWKDKVLWLDEETLDPKEGKHVLGEWGKASKELNKLIKDNDKGKLVVPASILELCQDNIDMLVEMAEQFATDAYEEAEAIGGDEPWENKLEKSEKELDKAQDALDHLDKDGNPDPKYDKAIKHFKKAWKHAQKAIEIAEE